MFQDLAGTRISDLATSIEGSSVKEIHASSADPSVLSTVFRHEYPKLRDINAANWFKEIDGFDENCTRCVIATDHTLAGAASSAMPVFTDGGAPISDVAAHFGSTMSDFPTVTGYGAVVDQMHALGQGSRGVVYIGKMVEGPQGPTPWGHVFNVVNDRNGVVFLDGQVGGFARLFDFEQMRLLITNAGRSS